ncbi:MAG: hypothetical protein J6Q22_00295, partial [Prevotella sp.]|nr:hypothetical protein [Prevotella sp.]
MQRYEKIHVLPNFALRFGAIFSTNLTNLNETQFRALESVIFEPLRLRFIESGQDRQFGLPHHHFATLPL